MKTVITPWINTWNKGGNKFLSFFDIEKQVGTKYERTETYAKYIDKHGEEKTELAYVKWKHP